MRRCSYCDFTKIMDKCSTKVILFYKYATLTEDGSLMKKYRDDTHKLCQHLNLFGRILLGLSRNEGINGTLSGKHEDLIAYTIAMLGRDYYAAEESSKRELPVSSERLEAIHAFWDASESFAQRANILVLTMDSPEDFKWSDAQRVAPVFPDLNVKVVKEIISTGGVLSSITLSETNQGYLTPEEFHQEVNNYIQNRDVDAAEDDDTIVIDCRNHKEFQIGHFAGALDPNTKTFEQFPKWVKDHKSDLDGKKVLMYCTGGIRCEKASAYVRKQTNASAVYHLRGGIHKYLEKYGSDGLFQGKNFVFDRRGADEPLPKVSSTDADFNNSSCHANSIIVGKCLFCDSCWDTYTGDSVCTVCHESLLVCHTCRNDRKEYHCADHFYLKDCYFTNLTVFSSQGLTNQLLELEQHLEKIAVGKKYKQRRRTIMKQIHRVNSTLQERRDGNDTSGQPLETKKLCRSCGSESCDGECWGFHGLRRKERMDEGNHFSKQIVPVK